MISKKTQISDLKQRITLLGAKLENDDLGGYISTWVPADTIWASVTPIDESISMHDSVRGEAKSPAGVRYKIRIRAAYKLSLPARVQLRDKMLTVTTLPRLDPSRCWLDFMACDIQEEEMSYE